MTNQVAVNYFHAYLARHQTRRFKKGEIIVFQGEAPRSAFVVKTGTVKAYNLSVQGDEKPVAFYGPDNVFPMSWVYGRVASAIYYHEAFSDEVEVYVIEREEFVSYIRKRPELLYQELERILSDQMGGSIRLNALQHSRASDKLVYTLHYLAMTHGKAKDKELVEIMLDLTHQDFANLTGLTRETAATELNKLKKKGVISYGKGQPYRLHLNKLARMLNDQFIAEFKPDALAT